MCAHSCLADRVPQMKYGIAHFVFLLIWASGSRANATADGGAEVLGFMVTKDTNDLSSTEKDIEGDTCGFLMQGKKRVVGGSKDFRMTRTLANGIADPSFGNAGVSLSPGGLMLKLFARPNGKLLGVGNSTAGNFDTQKNVVKLFQVTHNGVPDVTFGVNGVIEVDPSNPEMMFRSIRGAQLLPDGAILAYGVETANGMAKSSFFFKVTPKGAFDAAYGVRDLGSWVTFLAPKMSAKDVDPSALTRFLGLRKRGISACYEKELKQNPALSGKIGLRFVLTPAGKAAEIEILEDTFHVETMAACIVTKFRYWKFPFSPAVGVSVTYPVLLGAVE
jgi:hypothetical protein